MRSTRKLRGAIASAATAVCATTLVATAIPAAAVTKVTAVGIVHCTATGKVKFSPGLQATARKTKLKVSAVVACSQGDTGNPSVIVATGKVSAAIISASAACTTTDFGSGTGKAKWKAADGKVASSKLTWSSATVTDGTNVTIDLKGVGAVGSYVGQDMRLHVVGDAGGLCAGAAKGFEFSGAGGTSTFDIGSSNPMNLPIEHVLVLMQENRSADTYLAPLSTQGQPAYEPEPTTGNPDPTNPSGPPIVPFHKTTYCEVADLDHSWNGTHAEVNGGAMDGFTAQNAIPEDPTGSRAMGYYDQSDLPFYYGMYNTFATGDRYFCSALTQTFPNRLYLLAGTSFGHIRNDVFASTHMSIFEQLDLHAVSWKIYHSQAGLSYGALFFKYVADRAAAHVFPMSQYFDDLANGNLPDMSFVDPELIDTPTQENDEHPPANVQVGQQFVAGVVNALMSSSAWASSAFFFAYDEHGGFYDHVTPPAAPLPDNIPPILQAGDTPGAFDQYGVRVPVAVVSPYSKPHFVSHVVHDHTSILRFIEQRFGLPAISQRDAVADPMMEFFDFSTPTFATPPTLPTAVIDPGQLAACEAP